jgi:hypothetical protein
VSILTETKTADVLASLSRWIDEAQGDRNAEAVLWGRVAKIAEEHGEVIAALIGATGQNPRKGVTHTMFDVAEELLDVAITALCAYEHLSGNDGSSLVALLTKVEQVGLRAGVVKPTATTHDPAVAADRSA